MIIRIVKDKALWVFIGFTTALICLGYYLEHIELMSH